MGELGERIVGSGEKFRKFAGIKKKEDKPFKKEEHGALGILIHELRGKKGQDIKRELSKLGEAAKGQVTELKEFADTAIAIHKGEAKVTEKRDPKELFEEWSKELSKALKEGDTNKYNELLAQAERHKVKLRDIA